MRLGFWNRLALVLGIVASVGGSTALWLHFNREEGEQQSEGYARCIKAITDWDLCDKIWNARKWPYYGWSEWLFGLAALAVASLFLYLMTWAIVATAKWVWRGRPQKKFRNGMMAA